MSKVIITCTRCSWRSSMQSPLGWLPQPIFDISHFVSLSPTMESTLALCTSMKMQDKKFIVTLYGVNERPKFNMTEQPQECLDIWLSNQKTLFQPLHLEHAHGRTRTVKVDFGQSEASLPSAIYNCHLGVSRRLHSKSSGQFPLTAAIFCIVYFVSLFEVIPIAHERFHMSHVILHKNMNMVAMLTCDVLLRHFRKQKFHGGIGGCTLLSLMYSCYIISH